MGLNPPPLDSPRHRRASQAEEDRPEGWPHGRGHEPAGHGRPVWRARRGREAGERSRSPHPFPLPEGEGVNQAGRGSPHGDVALPEAALKEKGPENRAL